MQFTTDGTVTSAEGTSAHKVVHTVTGLTKVIDGVNTLVMWDRDYSDGELAESELAFFAQSEDGDVWLFGEYPEEYENGEAGGCAQHLHQRDRQGAGRNRDAGPSADRYAGVRPGLCAQGRFPRLRRRAREGTRRVCVPTGCYDDVLVIDEFNPLDPPSAGHQRKFYFRRHRARVG